MLRPDMSGASARSTSHRRYTAHPMGVVVLTFLLLVSGIAGGVRPTAAQTGPSSDGVRHLTGQVTIENPNQLSTTSEAFMMLLDMTAFIERDRELPPPPDSEVIAPLVGDIAKGADFDIPLPIEPLGNLNDVGNANGDGTGVQIFSIEYTSNFVGDPFIGPYEGGGWGTAESSLETRPVDLEVTGGTIAVWAPDDQQAFPTDFGDDGKLFTKDDPTGPVPAGWTIVDLNTSPFAQSRDAEVPIEIITGDDGFSDFSSQGFVDAFDSLIEELRPGYAFTEIKNIDFDALVAKYRPIIEQAETDNNFDAFQDAIYEFALEFHDGHTSSAPSSSFVSDRIGGRLGMRIQKDDAGDNIVVGVADGLPAADAGIKPGAVVSQWNGGSVEDAVAAEEIIISQSNPTGLLAQQYQFLTRGPVGERVSVTFQNPEASAPETVDLTFGNDVDGADVALNTRVDTPVDDRDTLPISTRLLPSGVGYIRMNTFLADPVLFTTSWNYAIQILVANGATGFVIDVRGNGGGYGSLATYTAGTFTNDEFVLDESYYPDGEGGHVPYDKERVLPVDLGVSDLPVAVLTDLNCASACEIFTAAVANDPKHLIVSFTSTAGIEAGVYSWSLSGGLPFQASYIRLQNPDGSVFLEGYGVTPNVRIPSEPDTLVVGDGDVELTYAEAAVVAVLNGDDPRNQEGGNIPPAERASTPVPDATPDLNATPATEATPSADSGTADSLDQSTPEA
jgi:C-terminal processing protease CtpA/Prc